VKQLYSSYDESCALFYSLEALYPEHVRIEVIGQTWEKRDLIVVTLSQDINTAHTRPALFFTGTIHAREWIGHELAIAFCSYVTDKIAYDYRVQEAFANSTMYLVPCANPDGFEYSRTHFSFWRKNRRHNADGSFGVDLNRNFPIGWQKNNTPSSNIYGGPEPFSEPETCALRDFFLSHPNITIALDYHSQGNVFFPAHDFRHEDTIDTTDMNVLCANMAEEIRKISNRKYGIHQGKPPATLISGSGREFYYSNGAIASVVEVGTRNISDYLEDMQEHIKENIPALLSALKAAPYYAKENPLKRVEHFQIEGVTHDSVTLTWDYESDGAIYFELYRNESDKSYCHPFSLATITQANSYTDINLESAKDYFYYIRAVDKRTGLKSPFAPRLRLETPVADDEFNRLYYPPAQSIGYVCEKFEDNKKHFGVNSLFVGIDERRGISYGVIGFRFDTMPPNVSIKSARLSVYPINRVSTTIEKFGEWSVCVLDHEHLEECTNYDAIHHAPILSYIGHAVPSNHLTQGIWKQWNFTERECRVLEEAITKGEILFRMEGPQSLKIGRNSQMMSWDIGYGKFGYGLNYRPKLEIVFETTPTEVPLYPKHSYSVFLERVDESVVQCGFDGDANPVYSSFEFSLSSLPDFEYVVITKAWLELNATNVYTKDDIRFHLEMIEDSIERNYSAISARNIIQNIGYDVSANELSTTKRQLFVFDTYSLKALNTRLIGERKAAFLLRPTSAKKIAKNRYVTWEHKNPELAPKLFLHYVTKRRNPVDTITNASLKIENGMIKVMWKNPDHPEFVGVKVVKNRFRPPRNHADGQKIYGGKDSYTFDTFGAKDIGKYFAIFTYDNVPNYSEGIVLEYQP